MFIKIGNIIGEAAEQCGRTRGAGGHRYRAHTSRGSDAIMSPVGWSRSNHPLSRNDLEPSRGNKHMYGGSSDIIPFSLLIPLMAN